MPNVWDMSDDVRVRLENALRLLREQHGELGDAEGAVAEYCRARHSEGALPETVVVEIKRLAFQILGRDNAHLDRLVTRCITHFYQAHSEAGKAV